MTDYKEHFGEAPSAKLIDVLNLNPAGFEAIL